MDKICKICGKEFERALSFSHLKRMHNISFKEYKEKYSPDVKWTSPLKGKDTWNKGKILKGDPKYSKMGHRVPHSEKTKRKLRKIKKQEYIDHPDRRYAISKENLEWHKNNPGGLRGWKVSHQKGSFAGEKHPMYGKKHSEKTRKLLSQATLSYLVIHPEVSIEKVRQMKENYSSEDHSKVMKEKFRDLDFHTKAMSALMSGKKMSFYEKRALDLIERNKLPYKYVGNGQLWINRLNPDFVHNDTKIIIEVYSIYHLGYWKPFDYESKRSEHFSKYGFKTVFLNENDLFREDWEMHCLKKLE